MLMHSYSFHCFIHKYNYPYFIDEETGSPESELFELITVTEANPTSKS